MYVVTYDNGSGYREWASSPQPTKEKAWEASGWKPGDCPWVGADPQVEDVTLPMKS